MVIDFHTHIFPDKIAEKTIGVLGKNANILPSTRGTADSLVEHMKASGVDLSINLPVLTSPTQFESVLEFAKRINENYLSKEQKILSFAGMHPRCENVYQKLKQVKDAGIKGIKIHPDYQGTFIDDEGYIEILSIAKELDLITVTHSGVDDGFPNEEVKCTPERLVKVIEKVKPEKFVLGHYGAHKQWQKVYELLCDFDVYFDTAFTFHEIDKELFIKILNAHGADKVLFATDSPWRDQKKDLEILSSYNLDKDVLDKILYKNAIRLLRIGE